MNGFQLESDVTVNPDCVAPIKDEVVNICCFQFSCAAQSCKWLPACCVRSVHNIRELCWGNKFQLHYS